MALVHRFDFGAAAQRPHRDVTVGAVVDVERADVGGVQSSLRRLFGCIRRIPEYSPRGG